MPLLELHPLAFVKLLVRNPGHRGHVKKQVAFRGLDEPESFVGQLLDRAFGHGGHFHKKRVGRSTDEPVSIHAGGSLLNAAGLQVERLIRAGYVKLVKDFRVNWKSLQRGFVQNLTVPW